MNKKILTKSATKLLPPQAKLALKLLQNKKAQKVLKVGLKANLYIWMGFCIAIFLCLFVLGGTFFLNNGFNSETASSFQENYGSNSAQSSGPSPTGGKITNFINSLDIDGVSSLEYALRNYFEQSICQRIPPETRPLECK
ncbi:MAG: hypothetical protein Kow0081_0020 [Candidatus Dojkabacteria bacterium]